MATALFLLVGGLTLLAIVLLARWLDAVAWRKSLVAIELHLPFGLELPDIDRWLNAVAAGMHPHRLGLLFGPPVILEVTATSDGVQHMLLVPKGLRDAVLAGLRAALPGVRLDEVPDYLPSRPRCRLGIEATLTHRQRQLSVARGEGVATAILATLQPLDAGEIVVVQWIVTGAGTPQPVPSSVQHNVLPAWITGEDLRDGEAVRAARAKQVEALHFASLRIGVRAGSAKRSWSLLGRVCGQHRGENAPGVMLVRRWWMSAAWAANRLNHRAIPTVRYPLRLSTAELAGLLPLPLGEAALPGVQLGMARQLPPPATVLGEGVELGVSNYPDMPVSLRLTDADRLQHVHILGPTGTGKSTLLARLIVQDIEAGHGVVVIDPKSDLVRAVLDRVPDHRTKDVIVLDPAAEPPIGFNILESGRDEQSRELVVDHVIHIWHEIYKDFWGPRSEDVLRGALLTLTNTKASNGQGFTLVETPELLVNNSFRKFVTEQDGVPAGLGSFWTWYRGMDTNERLKVIGPILNKLRAATLRTPIRLMLGQSHGVDLDRVLAERKILLVPLSAGTLGNETANLLGAILLAGVSFAVQRRVNLPGEARHPVFIYVDEAQNVLKLPVDLADMLSMARGLGTSYTLAHQHLGQIDDRQVKAALLGTVRSQVVFACLREDAAALAPSYAPYLTADDLMGAARYEFAARPLIAGQTLAPMTGKALPLSPPIRDGNALATRSRAQLGRPRTEVEAALRARSSALASDKPTASTSATTKRRTAFGRRRKSTANDQEATS